MTWQKHKLKSKSKMERKKKSKEGRKTLEDFDALYINDLSKIRQPKEIGFVNLTNQSPQLPLSFALPCLAEKAQIFLSVIIIQKYKNKNFDFISTLLLKEISRRQNLESAHHLLLFFFFIYNSNLSLIFVYIYFLLFAVSKEKICLLPEKQCMILSNSGNSWFFRQLKPLISSLYSLKQLFLWALLFQSLSFFTLLFLINPSGFLVLNAIEFYYTVTGSYSRVITLLAITIKKQMYPIFYLALVGLQRHGISGGTTVSYGGGLKLLEVMFGLTRNLQRQKSGRKPPLLIKSRRIHRCSSTTARMVLALLCILHGLLKKALSWDLIT